VFCYKSKILLRTSKKSFFLANSFLEPEIGNKRTRRVAKIKQAETVSTLYLVLPVPLEASLDENPLFHPLQYF
jgi:hypothetical protein